MNAAYYNEIDPKAAEWIRELIKAGEITDGEVDTRSIEDVVPADLAGFQRCHFFAGIGVWDYALNRAGWPDDRRVWTGSCPCQPFSAAGKGGGFDDERHLWPAWFHLINVGRPDTIFGEQVASKDGLTWLDLVSSDVEGIGYTIAPLDIPAAGVGAPHIRQRLFWVARGVGLADSTSAEYEKIPTKAKCAKLSQIELRGSCDANPLGENAISIGRRGQSQKSERSQICERGQPEVETAGRGSSGELANSASDGRERNGQSGTAQEGLQPQSERSGQLPSGLERRSSESGIVANTEYNGRRQSGNGRHLSSELSAKRNDERLPSEVSSPTLTNGFWHDAEWIYCTDEKYRPTKPGIFPLASRSTRDLGCGGDSSDEEVNSSAEGRVGRLRGYGNAINAEVAINFIQSYLEISDDAI